MDAHTEMPWTEKEMAQEQKPMYRVYTVIRRGRNDPFWLNIGVAFYHRDGQGLNIMLQALPLDDRLVLRQYEEEPPKETNGVLLPSTEPETRHET
jgi:hypothetical protein